MAKDLHFLYPEASIIPVVHALTYWVRDACSLNSLKLSGVSLMTPLPLPPSWGYLLILGVILQMAGSLAKKQKHNIKRKKVTLLRYQNAEILHLHPWVPWKILLNFSMITCESVVQPRGLLTSSHMPAFMSKNEHVTSHNIARRKVPYD